jgi:VIT1/CCC1 family predicted Fe2+/Mn2+ transporter
MRTSVRTGLSFGLNSGVITTLGLMIGLNASTGSKLAVTGGILTIAIADALSDSVGIQASEESKCKYSRNEIWQAGITTFFAKFFFALSFLIPIFLFDLTNAVKISIAWALLLITLFSIYIANLEKSSISKSIVRHLTLAVIVIILAQLAGNLINKLF